jgi:hypothetical protein
MVRCQISEAHRLHNRKGKQMTSIDVVRDKIRKTEDNQILNDLNPGQILFDVDERVRRLPSGADWNPYVTPVEVVKVYMSGKGVWCHGSVNLLWNRDPSMDYWVVPHEIDRLWRTRPCECEPQDSDWE